jgi:hypothetical protein
VVPAPNSELPRNSSDTDAAEKSEPAGGSTEADLNPTPEDKTRPNFPKSTEEATWGEGLDKSAP